MKKIFVLITCLLINTLPTFVSAAEFSQKSLANEILSVSTKMQDIEIDTEEITASIHKNQYLFFVIAFLAIMLILFIWLYTSARETARKRRITIQERDNMLKAKAEEIATWQVNYDSLKKDNAILQNNLEAEQNKTTQLSNRLVELKQETGTLTSKVEELQKQASMDISSETKQKIEQIELNKAKLKNLFELNQNGSLTTVEYEDLKKQVLNQITN